MFDIKAIIYVRIFYLGFLCVSYEVLSGVHVLRCLLRSYKVEQKVITCTLDIVSSASPHILRRAYDQRMLNKSEGVLSPTVKFIK